MGGGVVILRLLSVLLWVIMAASGMAAVTVSLVVGRTPITVLLAAVTVIALILGLLVDGRRLRTGDL